MFRSPPFRVDQEEAKTFASRFDPQPFHLDEAAAASSIFKGPAVSGWYTAAAVFNAILKSDIDLHGGIIGQRISGLDWLAPVRPGDVLTVESTVSKLEPSSRDPRRGIIELETFALNQDGQRVFRMLARILGQAVAK